MNLGKGVSPEPGLAYSCFIQRDICLADEAAGFVTLYLPVAQQEQVGLLIGELFGWIGLQRLRSGPESVEYLHIVDKSGFRPQGPV